MIWTDKSGKEWELWQMSDKHLLNTKNMVLRAAEKMDVEAEAAFCYPGQGDMATYYADQAADQASEEAAEFRMVAQAIDEEIIRRKNLWEKFKK